MKTKIQDIKSQININIKYLGNGQNLAAAECLGIFVGHLNPTISSGLQYGINSSGQTQL